MAFLVIAMAAPLASVSGGVALAIGLGNGIGVPGTFLVMTLILLLFSVGFAAMAREVVNTGAFYAYVGAAFGYRMGAAAGFVATVGYNILSPLAFAIGGFFAHQALLDFAGIEVAWWVCSFGFLLVSFVLGALGTGISTWVTGTLLVLECAFVLLVCVAVFAAQGPLAFSWEVFHPSNVFSGNYGFAFAFIFLCFIGFEATAIFSEEAQDPRRTVGQATRIAILSTGGLYVLASWCIIANFGMAKSLELASGAASGSMFTTTVASHLGHLGDLVCGILIITSNLALTNTVHATGARYIFAMSRARLLPSPLSGVNARSGSPVPAQIVQAGIVSIVLIVWAVLELDPFTDMGVVGTLGSVAIIALQATASFAIFWFFAKRGDTRPWETRVAPIAAGIALVIVLAAVVNAWPELIGFNTLPLRALPVLVPVVGVIGWLIANKRGPMAGEFATAGKSGLPGGAGHINTREIGSP